MKVILALPSPCHPRAATQWTRLLLRAAYDLQRTRRLTMHVSRDDSAVFRFLSPVILTFDLWPSHSNSGETFVQCT